MNRGYWVNVAMENGISPNVFYQRKRRGWDSESAATTKTMKRGRPAGKHEYAVYKGDDLIVIGTAEECAEFMGVTARYIRWMTTPSAQKKLSRWKNPTIAIRLEDD